MHFTDYHWDSDDLREQATKLSTEMIESINCILRIQMLIEIARVKADITDAQAETLKNVADHLSKISAHCKEVFLDCDCIE